MGSINTSKIGEYIEERFNEEIPENLTYHNLIHTEYVVSQAKLIGEKSGLSDEEIDMVVTAAWFHDSGFAVSHIEHEEESKKIAQQYLSDHGIRQDITDRILKCIDSTRMPQDLGDDLLSKEKLPGRGVESMFRLTARNQINLSSIADNKANLLISVNSIVLTVLLTVGVGKITDNANFTIPAIVFIATCLVTITFAILSTRPKISSGKFTKEDILNQKVNLLFFGNFYNMEFEEYEWAVKEMMKDYNYLYNSMIRDQHSLGRVISQKYKLLRIAYSIFMYGLILSTISFAIVVLVFPI